VHSITTDDHYASYDSPYKNSSEARGSNVVGGNGNVDGSSSRLNELNRLSSYQNSSSNSLVGSSANSISNGRNNAQNIGYKPGFKSNGSDVQLQTLNQNGQPPLPTIDSLWDRIERWIEEEYPELEDYINDGVTTADLNEFENDLGCGSLPSEFRQFYKRHDGQFRGGKPTGLIMGLAILDLEGIAEEYTVWSKVAERLERQQYIIQQQQREQQKQEAEETSSSTATANGAAQRPLNNTFIANQRSIPPNAVQPYYYHKGWVPILKDHIGNQIALDLSPGPSGNWGQVIIFGRDYDTKLVVASSFQEFIFNFVSDLEAGNYQIDSEQFQEDLGFLSSSRNDDYGVGDEDEDQGELNYYDKDGKEFGKGAIKGSLSYLEVMRKRALKKYGLTENFSTAFTPQRVIKKPSASPTAGASGSSSNALRSESPLLSHSDASFTNVNGKGPGSSPLINVESASVSLPKETLIDEKKDVEVAADKTEEPSKAVKEEKEQGKEENKTQRNEENEAEAATEEADEPLIKPSSDDEAEQQVVDGLKEVEL